MFQSFLSKMRENGMLINKMPDLNKYVKIDWEPDRCNGKKIREMPSRITLTNIS